MLNYIIQVLTIQIVFLLIYDLVLRKETFYQWNRVYLLSTSVLAYILPWLKVPQVQEKLPTEYTILLPEVMINADGYLEENVVNVAHYFDWLGFVYLLGVIIMAVVFLSKMIQIVWLTKCNPKTKKEFYHLISITNSTTAFSFFNYIFIGTGTCQKEQIIKHELVHVRQKHSVDLLFFEFQKIVCWFNPIVYIYQSRITELHEFIADSKTVNPKNKQVYFESLLSQIFQVSQFSFVNSFYKKSLIKKRIIMLGKVKSREILKLKYLLFIPVLAIMLVYTSCEQGSVNTDLKQGNNKRKITTYLSSMNSKNYGEVKELKSEKEAYFDLYINLLVSDAREIDEEALTEAEKTEFNELRDIFSKYGYESKLFERNNGQRAVSLMYNKTLKSKEEVDYVSTDILPFSAVDQAPLFPSCMDAENSKVCFSEKITAYVSEHFNTEITKGLGLAKGKKRVFVQFTINKEGEVKDLKARGPHQLIEDEAIRVISDLPHFTPATYQGNPVNVKYTLPINIAID